MAQSTMNNNNNSFNNTNNVNVWNYTVADDRPQLLTWLSPLEPQLRHRDIRERRIYNVGEWVTQAEEFRSWYASDRSVEDEGDKAVLFCYGDPGVGKTFISSLVVDRLCRQAGGQNTAVACFYFDFAARKEQTATSMLGSMLKQIVSGMERIPEGISQTFHRQKKVIGGPGLPDIVKMLQAVTSLQRTFMCIDALDECVAVQRFKLLDSLKQILAKSPGTRIFVTGRPQVQVEIEKRLAGRVISISIGPSHDDLITYIRVRLAEDETPDAMDESLEADILRKIPENISEMFLLVSLNTEAILQESTIYRRREKLSKITDGLGLGDAYGATIERIKVQGGDKPRLGMAALMWISHAERPLTGEELCHALAVNLGSTDFNAGNIPSMSTLLSCCQGLITLDKEASTMRLIHFTLQEYLSAPRDIFDRPHSVMAETCLTYIDSKQVRASPAGLSPITRDIPFLEYCSAYWGVHAKRELSERGTSLALKLLQEDYGQVPTEFLLSKIKYWARHYIHTWSPFSGLHCASFFGIVEVVAALIAIGSSDINGEDFLGYTPLAWAAHNGHEGVVEILLRQEEINPDKLDTDGRTPLSYAAENGHEAVVKILLGREEVNPDRLDYRGRSPLSHAAWYGREGVVNMLLGREEVNPDSPGNRGRTPLPYEAFYGR